MRLTIHTNPERDELFISTEMPSAKIKSAQPSLSSKSHPGIPVMSASVLSLAMDGCEGG